MAGGDYTNPVQAIANVDAGDNWCGVPSAANRCLLRLMPGDYNVGAASFPGALVMRQFVDIDGSGSSTTRIFGTAASSLGGYPATVALASNAQLRNIAVENIGGGTYAFAITGSGTNRVGNLLNVAATASGGSSMNVAIINQNTGSNLAVLTNVSARAVGGDYATGIDNSCSAASINGAVAIASGATGNNTGIADSNDPINCQVNVRAFIFNLRAEASGGIYASGAQANQSQSTFISSVFLGSSASGSATGISGANANIRILGSYLSGTAAPASMALDFFTTGSVVVDHSVLSGSTQTVSARDTISVKIGGSRLDGGPVDGANVICAGVYDEGFTFFANTCP